ncbi:hypothetical protein D3C71_1476820 [compost metagenome]
MARLPPAPGLFSTTTGWPSRAVSPSATVCAMMSPLPPGATMTTILMGLLGYSSAWAVQASKAAAAASVADFNLSFMLVSVICFMSWSNAA